MVYFLASLLDTFVFPMSVSVFRRYVRAEVPLLLNSSRGALWLEYNITAS